MLRFSEKPVSQEFPKRCIHFENSLVDAMVHEFALINGCIIWHNQRRIYDRDDGFNYTGCDGKCHCGVDALLDRPCPRLSHSKT